MKPSMTVACPLELREHCTFTAMPHAQRQSGLTLLEIMITLVVLSLGLLGLAGLQMTGLKNNRNAYYNTVAGQAVEGIAEDLRVDSVTRGQVAGAIRTIDSNSGTCASDTFDHQVACLAGGLPGWGVRITQLNPSPQSFYVAVTWTDLQLNNTPSWSANTTAQTACGNPANNVSCYYTVVRP